MIYKIRVLVMILIALFFITMCGKTDTEDIELEDQKVQPLDYSAHELPGDIKWITNETDPVFASPEAKKGGTINFSIRSFPLTFRTVGPDANSGTRSLFSDNNLLLSRTAPEYSAIDTCIGKSLGI